MMRRLKTIMGLLMALPLLGCTRSPIHILEYVEEYDFIGTPEYPGSKIRPWQPFRLIDRALLSESFKKKARIVALLDIQKNGVVRHVEIKDIQDPRYRDVFERGLSKLKFNNPSPKNEKRSEIEASKGVQSPSRAESGDFHFPEEIHGYELVVTFRLNDHIDQPNYWK